MDIEEATNEFHDWELLQPNSDSNLPLVGNNSYEEIDSGSLVHRNYFSLDARSSDSDDTKSAASDNPSWIDPGLDDNPIRYLNKEPSEFWSDTSSERSQDRKFTDLEIIHEMAFSDNCVKDAISEGLGGIIEGGGEKNRDLGKDDKRYSGVNDFIEKSPVDLAEAVNLPGEENKGHEKLLDDAESRKTGEAENRGVASWWMKPIELLKYCMLRLSPAMAVSVAAAFLGVVILARRLHRMKKTSKGLEIKLTVDDKKISQVMSRAARLNDAFSIVKLVPVIRPPVPAIGATTPWSVMSLR